MVRAIVLSGGASSRMGRPKAGLPIGVRGETFLSRLLHTLHRAGLPDIVVVTGAHPGATHAATGRSRRAVRFVQNDAWASGQLSSLLCGLHLPSATPLEAIVVALVDSPLVEPTTVRMLLHEWRTTGAPIVRPARGGEHGHPVVFDAALFSELNAADLTQGAKPVVRAHQHRILDVPVRDEGAFVDFDTEAQLSEVSRFRGFEERG